MADIKDTFGDTIRVTPRETKNGGVYLFLIFQDGEESSDMAIDENQVQHLIHLLRTECSRAER